MVGSILAIGGAAFHEDSLRDLVAVFRVAPKIVEVVDNPGRIGFWPEMVMRIDDLPVGVDDLLAVLVQPVIIVEHAFASSNPSASEGLYRYSKRKSVWGQEVAQRKFD